MIASKAVRRSRPECVASQVWAVGEHLAMYTRVTSAWVGVFASHSSHSSHFQLSRLEIRVS